MIELFLIIFILSIIFIIVCDLDVALVAIILMHIFAISICYQNKRSDTKIESFEPISKTSDDEKYGVLVPEEYEAVVHELNNVTHNIKNENYDNMMDLNDFSISKPPTDAYQMLDELLKTNDEDADYKIASLSAEMSRRNKQASNYRSRLNSENTRYSMGLDEELDEADNRQWFDRDQLDLDF